LKTLLNRALSFDKIDRNPYDKLKGKFKRGDRENVEYLTEEEMKRFEAIILPKGSVLDIVHDLFIFQMYTGLPYSDMQAFDANDYKWDGKAWKNVGERIKTGVPYVSQLLPPAVRVLEKYGWEIPQMSNADYNRHLKSLGQMAGIKTRLHSHLARHTFATYMLRNGVKIENVSKMLGHTNITQTQRYAKVLAQSVHDDFDMIAVKLGRPNKNKKLNTKNK
jgi:integrase